MSDKKLPIIFESETSNLLKNKEPAESKQRTYHSQDSGSGIIPKIIYLILAAIIVVEVIVGIKTLTTALPETPKSPTTKALVGGGKISLSTEQRTFTAGDSVAVKISIETGRYRVIGADIILKFDPNLLEADKNGVKAGSTFSDYPFIDIDNKNGLVQISGIAPKSSSGFKGKGEFATVNFKTKAKGSSLISIDFKPGSTIDSNLIEDRVSQDIIESVEDLKITIR